MGSTAGNEEAVAPVDVALVPTNGSLPTAEDFTRAEQTIQLLVAEGDPETLFSASKAAEATALFYQRQGQLELVGRMVRLKLLAEAGIGWIDVRDHHPTRYGQDALMLGGQRIGKGLREGWRVLGIGHARGLLAAVMDDLELEDKLCTWYAIRRLQLMGAIWADLAPIKKAWRASGLTIKDAGEKAGVSPACAWFLLGDSRQEITRFVTAIRLAQALGVPIEELRPKVLAGRSRSKQARDQARRRAAVRALQREEQRKAAKRLGGKVDLTYSRMLLFSQALDAAWREAPQGSEQRDHLERAYGWLGEVEQEVGRALGTS